MLCKRSFLGFQTCECALCHARHQEPLTTAYRVTYWIVGIFFALVLLERLPLIAQAATTSGPATAYMLFQQWFLVLFIIGAIVALRRDARLRAAAAASPGRLQQSRQPPA
jgi:hypothetical protein